jgi:hypothetical protein
VASFSIFVFHLYWSLVTVALVGTALLIVLYLIRFQQQDSGGSMTKGWSLFNGDVDRLLKSAPSVVLRVMVVSFLVGNINEVFVFVVAANVLLPETK